MVHTNLKKKAQQHPIAPHLPVKKKKKKVVCLIYLKIQ